MVDFYKEGVASRFGIKTFLLELKTEYSKPIDSVFLVNGEILKVDRLLRVWKGRTYRGKFHPGIVMRFVDSGEINRYRKPYAMRHSFISYTISLSS